MSHRYMHIFLYLTCAVIILFFAHVARAVRWALLFPAGYLVGRFSLLFGLSVGYAINTILPFHVGEIARVLYVSKRERVSFSFVLASVVVERLTDLLVISIVILSISTFSLEENSFILHVAISMLIGSIAVIAAGSLIHKSIRIRKIIWRISSIFNEKIRISIVEFCWSFSELLVDGVLRVNYLIASLMMWFLYFASYLIFSEGTGENYFTTFTVLMGNPLLPLSSNISTIAQQSSYALMAYAALPIVAVIIYGFFRQRSPIIRKFSIYWKYGGVKYGAGLFPMQGRFEQNKEYEYFLTCLFKGNDFILSSYGFKAIGAGTVHRFFNGGSEAIIALIEEDRRLVIRKFAVGNAAIKLKTQVDWIKFHRNSGLPIVEIVGELMSAEFFRYDMPYELTSIDFYDVIHTEPIKNSASLLSNVCKQINLFHKAHESNIADKDMVATYLKQKAIFNVELILKAVERYLPGNEYSINGQRYLLSDWDCMRDLDWLLNQVHNYKTSVIHGDLTIENIIVCPEKKEGFYFIDPNPENIFNSPMIDYAKLMQSLHLGYEGLHRGVACTVSGKEIRLNIARSYEYAILHNDFEKLIIDGFGCKTLKEVYFHELINYLRLTPYKLKENHMIGLTFFFCTSILLKRYLELKYE